MSFVFAVVTISAWKRNQRYGAIVVMVKVIVESEVEGRHGQGAQRSTMLILQIPARHWFTALVSATV